MDGTWGGGTSCGPASPPAPRWPAALPRVPVARRGRARCASRTSSSAGRRARSSTRRISSASEAGRRSTPSSPGSPAGLVEHLRSGERGRDRHVVRAGRRSCSRTRCRSRSPAWPPPCWARSWPGRTPGSPRSRTSRAGRSRPWSARTTFLDIRTLTLKGYGFDLQKDTQLVTAQAPPDMVTMIAKKDVDAMIAWQPMSDPSCQRGDGVYLVEADRPLAQGDRARDGIPRPRVLRSSTRASSRRTRRSRRISTTPSATP